MLVQRVLMPASSLESWTVLGDDDLPVGPVERYLAYLTDIERSPNTVRAYAPTPSGAANVSNSHTRSVALIISSDQSYGFGE